MKATNKAMVIAGIATLAGGQILFTTLAVLQYFCVIDFLGQLPLLIFIKVVYFHNPSTCGLRIPIGETLDSMPDQALVLLTRSPFTATRTFYINAANLSLSVVWLITCFGITRGGAITKESKPIRWPWIIATVLVCGLDLAATVTYINDSFHTRTFSDLVDYIGGTTSGTGNIDLSTTWVAWIMVLIYSRFVIFFLLNLTLIVIVVIHVSAQRMVESTGVQVEAQTTTQDAGTEADLDVSSHTDSESQPVLPEIPRPGFSQTFRLMKERLFGRSNVPPDRATNATQVAITSEAIRTDSPDVIPDRRRGTAAATELQAQLPWSYVPGAAAHHMRDQLPPDEDLPPVPLPDYTVIPAYRKASVHRAASSLSSLAQKREEKYQIPRPPLTSLDVLY